jgi:hypothetical protein
MGGDGLGNNFFWGAARPFGFQGLKDLIPYLVVCTADRI